jgi:hypothetical protein
MKPRKILETNGVDKICVECGIGTMWNKKPITLHVDHKDGNNKNDELTNLRYLCPNCHSQTDTYAGRNVKSRDSTWKLISDEMYLESIRSSKSIKESIERLHLNPKNHLIINRVKDLMKNNDLTFSTHKREYILDQVELIKNSGIDFHRFGWVEKASVILKVSPQKVGPWMRRNMPEFYFDKCFVRKLA